MKECKYLLEKSKEEVDRIVAAVSSNNITTVMPCWYYDKKDLRVTPSINDGISIETERRYRKEGARFIMNCGTKMSLGHNTMATGVVYFHRFYMFRSFKTFPRYVTACCCLFLAGKVEETPKKCRDIIKTARSLLTDAQFFSFGDDPKEEVMTLERILLQTIKFDLQVEHPYTFLLKYAKCFKGDQQKRQKMVQMAWNFVNDSLSTVVCLQWEPEIIAVALIHLASKLSKFTVADWIGRTPIHLRWWDMFVSDVTMEILEDICHQVLDLYQQNQTGNHAVSNSPPQIPPSRVESPTPTPAVVGKPKPTSPIATVITTAPTITTVPVTKGNPISAIGSAIPSLVPSNSGMTSHTYVGGKLAASSVDMHDNNISNTAIIKPLPPPPDPMGYLYSAVSNWNTPRYPPPSNANTLAPPLPPPPQLYGQFQQMTGHYNTAVPPQMQMVGHRAPPPPHPPANNSGGGSYYQQQPQYGRQQRYPPS